MIDNSMLFQFFSISTILFIFIYGLKQKHLVNTMSMVVVFIRVVIIYITALLFLRLMGKRQIGEMQPYEVCITLIIADLATLPMSDTNIPLLNGLLPLAILVMLHYGITFCTRKSLFLRKIISGKPVIIISPNGIEYQALKELNMNLDDLQEMLRGCNYYSFDQVSYAIVETNGKMSVIPSASSSPLTAKDMQIKLPEPALPSVIISDGKIVKNKLEEQEISMVNLEKLLKKLKIKKIKDVIVMSVDKDKKLYYQLKNESFQVIQDYTKK